MYFQALTDIRFMSAVLLLLMIGSVPACPDVSQLVKEGVGPFAVCVKVEIRNEKEELVAFPRKVAEVTASARNDSGQPIQQATFCVQAERRMKGCDFKLKTHAVWKPDEQLVWTLDGPAHRGIENPKITITELKTEVPSSTETPAQSRR
jgi:hypothetical protein